MTSRGYEQPVDQQSELVRLADRTARAVETIRTVVVIWAIATLLAGFVILVEVLKASAGNA